MNTGKHKISRHKTKEVNIAGIKIGGDNPIIVQSMCNTKTTDVPATVRQIRQLEESGCELVRITIPDIEAARCIKQIKQKISIPLVADIHYNHELAIESMRQGIDKIRINPGNIPQDKLRLIVEEAKKTKTAIRIGLNGGSLPKEIIKKHGHSSRALVEGALSTIKLFESLGFTDIVVSLKSSDIFQTIEANELLAEKCSYPIHLGITEAGTIRTGTIKSGIGLGNLLMKGIGDTIRVSLSADPVEEVIAAHIMLRSLNLRKGALIVSCPTCGRTTIDVIKTANVLEQKIMKITKPVRVGVMGCFVNVDEAKIADIGIAGTAKEGILFKNGKILRKVPKQHLIDELLIELNKL